MLDASPAPTFDLDAFRAWLVANGAEIIPSPRRTEVMRADSALGVIVIDTMRGGRPRGPNHVADLVQAFADGGSLDLKPKARVTPDFQRSPKSLARHAVLAARDGPGCWFCGCDKPLTIEHLVAKAHGGPNHRSNLVLACSDCNAEAGNLSVAEKVRLREAKRAVPDLLAALTEILDTFDTFAGVPFQHPADSPWAKARAAVAKVPRP